MRSYSSSVSRGGSRPSRASARRSTPARRYQLQELVAGDPVQPGARRRPPRNARRSATAAANVSAISSVATCGSNVRRAKNATSARAWVAVEAGDVVGVERHVSTLRDATPRNCDRWPSAAAGILLFRRTAELEVLLVHPGGPFWAKKDLGAWSIPKGEHDDAEDALRVRAARVRGGDRHAPDAGRARRPRHGQAEIGQGRAGLGARGRPRRGARSARTRSRWSGRRAPGASSEFPEVDRAEWFALEEARERINPAQAAFLDRLSSRFDS